MTMKPLNLLRALYRQLKTPAMHIPKDIIQNKNTSTTKASVIEAASTTTGNNKFRSNASTKFLIQQYRIAASVSSSPTDNTTTAPTQVSHSCSQQIQQHRFAMEYYLLRQDIHQRGELYMIDTGADQQLSPHELSRRAAARAGLQLPEQYKE
jgi:hypothetical protein